MRKLQIYIEINGNSVYVGDITGTDSHDACFAYAEAYVSDSENRSISISLPLEKRKFDAISTRNFFEGLLPEGFTRRCVAQWMHADENDYLTLLAGLGNECLGAIKVLSEDVEVEPSEYRKLTKSEVRSLALEGATESAQIVTKSHLSLTGASGKVGLYYDAQENQWFQPIGEAPSTHIVKQSHIRLKRIVVNEQLCLLTASYLGIETPRSFIINTGDSRDEAVLFATERYDRKVTTACRSLNGLMVPYRLHQEDFAQALGIAANAKYEKKGEDYLQRLFNILKDYSANPIEDQLKLWDICIFNYLIGNTDNHIKNISLLYGEDLKTIRLAPAYDIISTVIYESSTEDMALSIGGEYSIHKITRKAFELEALKLGMGVKLAMNRFDKMVAEFESALQEAASVLVQQGYEQVDEICKEILCKGGIKAEIQA